MRILAYGPCVAVALAGCLVNVPLQAPPPNASPDERMQAYANLAPAATTTSVVVTNNAVTVHSELILHGGQIIADPADLLPVVDPQSVTAVAAQRSADARSTARVWGIAALVGVVAGAIVLAADGIQTPGVDAMGNATGGITTTGVVAIVGMSVAAVVGGIGAAYYNHIAHEQKQAAFATYDDALRAHLRICANGLQVVPCP
jgi:hypothetical protein